ncbi:hypothetical protein NDU88_005463 [Pleurodeles waltl]|uniref:Uncharacterized protein n=1 Tax=Pleurodeles waltl TaxID=8319 RepID=A0AAV7L4I2_PLEWA|nr:hypothetical protein NDU88_005463 [Pleurodeles waltl]
MASTVVLFTPEVATLRPHTITQCGAALELRHTGAVVERYSTHMSLTIQLVPHTCLPGTDVIKTKEVCAAHVTPSKARCGGPLVEHKHPRATAMDARCYGAEIADELKMKLTGNDDKLQDDLERWKTLVCRRIFYL